jgi:tetratricopeptide (TPR) repeat protein
MKITSPNLSASQFTANDQALTRCQNALELKDKGDYGSAREAMGFLWERVGDHPQVKGLHGSVVAEVLICVGILTSWIGSKDGIEKAQETAKNLISEGINFHESAGDVKKVAAAQAEIAYCYFREGALDEARIMLTEAIQKLTTEGNTRARALLKLTTVEWAASRYNVALEILNDNAYLFKKVTNHTIKANYHNELAIVLRHLARSDSLKRENLLQRAVCEFERADHHLQLAKNKVFRISVKNNVGLILFNLSRFKEAHRHLEEARRLAINVRNKVQTAEIDESRAQVFIAERKFKDAAAVARNAVRVLEKSGHQCLLADALVTQGIALARLKQNDHAQFIFQKAIEVAHQVGALNKAGLAALTMIEELDELVPETLYAAYDRASEWLATSQSQDLLLRVNTAARKVFWKLHGESKGEPTNAEKANAEVATAADRIEALLNKPCHLPSEVLKFEGSLIRQALAKASGSVTRAAALLSVSYQALAYILESRHKDLLKERSPIRRRSRREPAPGESLNS